MSRREETILGPDGAPRVLSKQCSTCIGRPGNLMNLRPGRLQQMVRAGVNGQGFPCHQTLSYGGYPGFGPAMCRWFYDTYGYLCNFVRVMSRIGGGFTEVDPPSEENEETG